MSSTRHVVTTAICCILFLVVTTRMHAGFMALMMLPFLAIWCLSCAWTMWRQPGRRRQQTIKLLMWGAALGIVAAVHLYYAHAARQDAGRALAAITEYRIRHKAYPATLAQAGLDQAALKKRWMLSYVLDAGRPQLVYAVTFTAFETWSYDFATSKWVYRPD